MLIDILKFLYLCSIMTVFCINLLLRSILPSDGRLDWNFLRIFFDVVQATFPKLFHTSTSSYCYIKIPRRFKNYNIEKGVWYMVSQFVHSKSSSLSRKRTALKRCSNTEQQGAYRQRHVRSFFLYCIIIMTLLQLIFCTVITLSYQ